MKRKIIHNSGFTLIEILIVISIIAILASTILPNFIGFDAEARITATKSNLESIRTRINLYRAKEGRYPTSMQDLVNTEYFDMGVRKPYLRKIPTELVSDQKGVAKATTISSTDDLTNDGGWVYIRDLAEVKVNITEELDKNWGKYEGEIPSEW